MKNRICYSITIVILSTKFLIGCSISTIDSTSNTHNNNANQTDNHHLVNNYNSIQQLAQDFKKSLQNFNDELRLVVKKDKDRENVSSKNSLERLEKLQKEIELLRQNLPASKNTQITSILDNMTSTIQDIDNILLPLKNGLTQDGVKQVQKKLNFFSRRNISQKFYGDFGSTTQEEVNLFTQKNLDKLDNQFLDLQHLVGVNDIASLNNTQTSKVINSNTNKQYTNLVLKNEILDIQNSINKLAINVTIGGLIVLILIIICIYINIYLIKAQNKNSNLIKSTQDLINTNNSDVHLQLNKIYDSLTDFEQRLKQIEQHNSLIQDLNHSSYNQTNNIETNENIAYFPQQINEFSSSPKDIFNLNTDLVSTYNLNSRSLSNQAVTVSESEYTVEQRRLGRSVAPILELNNRGNYWIIKEGNDEYLVPKGNIKINEHNYRTISTFFECLGYVKGFHDKFILVKPAKVVSIKDQWELREAGQLLF